MISPFRSGRGPSPTTSCATRTIRNLAGFFLGRQGSFGTFLFDDPTDDAVIGASIGTGDGVTVEFQLGRLFNIWFYEPIYAPHVVSHLYVNGTDPGGWTVDSLTGKVTFASAPANATALTADFTYYFRVRFADDTAEFSNFMYQLWELKQVKLQSVLP